MCIRDSLRETSDVINSLRDFVSFWGQCIALQQTVVDLCSLDMVAMHSPVEYLQEWQRLRYMKDHIPHMRTSEICWALEPDLMFEKLIYFHALSPMDLGDFDEINFPNGKPSEPAGPFIEPEDRVANFGQYRGSHFSNILLTHFSYYCWALKQEEPHSGLQDFIDYCDVQLHDNKVRVTSADRERFDQIKDSRKAPNRLERFRPDAASRANPGTPSTVPDPADFKPQTFYRTMTSLEYTSFMKNHTIPVRD
eukprot:13725421-Alexandrium_andersonii.AAC.1